MKRLVLLVVGVLLGAHGRGACCSDRSDDQQSVIQDAVATFGSDMGQWFTPSLNTIDAAEFLLGTDGASSTVQLDLFSGIGYGGALLGSSAPLLITNSFPLQTIHFDFLPSIALTPGNPYTFKLVLTSGGSYRAGGVKLQSLLRRAIL